MGKPLWEERIPAGSHWSGFIRRGTTLKLTDVEGGANVSALFYNFEEKLERYNMADTLKAQHTAYLTAGHVCYSDMGRILCAVTEDTCGWHDTICGLSNAKLMQQKYGESIYQNARNDMIRNGRDSLIIELGKYGLGKRDIVPNVNFFSKVVADDAGNLVFVPQQKAGVAVCLRFEMNTLVVLSTSPHPLDPNPEYAPKPINIEAIQTGVAELNDPCRLSCPENGRAYVNTERYFA